MLALPGMMGLVARGPEDDRLRGEPTGRSSWGGKFGKLTAAGLSLADDAPCRGSTLELVGKDLVLRDEMACSVGK